MLQKQTGVIPPQQFELQQGIRQNQDQMKLDIGVVVEKARGNQSS